MFFNVSFSLISIPTNVMLTLFFLTFSYVTLLFTIVLQLPISKLEKLIINSKHVGAVKAIRYKI